MKTDFIVHFMKYVREVIVIVLFDCFVGLIAMPEMQPRPHVLGGRATPALCS